MPTDIKRLADAILTKPVKVEVTPVATTAEKIDQVAYLVEGQDAKRGLLEHVFKDSTVTRALVFMRTKHGADKVCRFLNSIQVSAEAIHGNKSQNNRVAALDNFKQGKTRVLVATDIAARGIDIDGVSHVINYEIPNVPETYVHRIGRTARAGAEGKSLSFVDRDERPYMRDIEKLTRQEVRIETENPFAPGVFVAPPRSATREPSRPPRSHSVGGNRRPQAGRRDSRTPSSESRHGGSRNRPASTTITQAPRTPQNSSARSTSTTASAARPGRSHSAGHAGGRRPSRGGSGAHSQRSNTRPGSGRPDHRRTSATNPTSTPKEAVATTGTEKKKPWWKRIISDE